jgi:hypothetical protein
MALPVGVQAEASTPLRCCSVLDSWLTAIRTECPAVALLKQRHSRRSAFLLNKDE